MDGRSDADIVMAGERLAERPAWWAPHVELAKVRLTSLVLFTTLVGYILGCGGAFEGWRILVLISGTFLAASGAHALNQWMEWRRDGLMERTRRRPLPSARLLPRQAFVCGVSLATVGPAILWVGINGLTAALGAITLVVYVLVYTPLKTRTSLCTLAGAVCGALPPMMGWTAATGHVGSGAWILGAILFVWQIPHFLALAWLYRDDYARGGFRMLPLTDRSGEITGHVVVLYSLALLPLGLALTLVGLTGWVYAAGSIVLGLGLLGLGARFFQSRTDPRARRLFLGSVIYLPLLLGLMLADRSVHRTSMPADGSAVAARSPAIGNDEV